MTTGAIVIMGHRCIAQVAFLIRSLAFIPTNLLIGSFHSNNNNILLQSTYEDNNAKYRSRANNMVNVEASIAQMVPTLSLSHLITCLPIYRLTHLHRDNCLIKLLIW